jgi:hypothetical protein
MRRRSLMVMGEVWKTAETDVPDLLSAIEPLL